MLLGALLLLTTPVQPWYAVTLGGVAVAAGRPEWLAVGVAGYPGYVATLLDRDARPVATLAYACAAALVVGVALLRRSGSAANARTPASNATAGA